MEKLTELRKQFEMKMRIVCHERDELKEKYEELKKENTFLRSQLGER